MGRGRPKSIIPKFVTSLSIPMSVKEKVDQSGFSLSLLVERGLMVSEFETALFNSEKIRAILQDQILALSDELAKYQLGLNDKSPGV